VASATVATRADAAGASGSARAYGASMSAHSTGADRATNASAHVTTSRGAAASRATAAGATAVATLRSATSARLATRSTALPSSSTAPAVRCAAYGPTTVREPDYHSQEKSEDVSPHEGASAATSGPGEMAPRTRMFGSVDDAAGPGRRVRCAEQPSKI